ncbi:MAG: PAS domain S-box protein [Magnetococcales bacterium]|nr:PAS domain S-box protein [Magnetococcales bacterium]
MTSSRCNRMGITPWLVFLLGCLAVFGSWGNARDHEINHSHQRFNREVVEHILAITHRMDSYEQSLRAVASLVTAIEVINRPIWQTFVEGLRVREMFPGIQGIGWAPFFRAGEMENHLQMVREELPDYTGPRPSGQRAFYAPILYLAAVEERNQKKIGEDLFAESTSRAAMERARDGGKAALSGKVVLREEIAGRMPAGIGMYIPIYRQGLPIATVAQRQEAIRGYVFAPLQMDDFMRGILGNRVHLIDLHVFDGLSRQEETLLYDSDGVFDRSESSLFHRFEIVEIAGRSWRLEFHATPEAIAAIDSQKSRIIAVGGMLINVLLFGLMHGLSRSRVRAVDLAERNTVALSSSKECTRTILDTAVHAIVTMGPDHCIQTFNLAAQKLFGYGAEEIIGQNVNVLMPEPYHSEHDGYVDHYVQTGERRVIGLGREVIGRRKDGSTFPLWLTVGSSQTGEGWLFVGCIVDISDRKKADEKIRTLSLAVEQSPSVVIITDLSGDIVYTNPRFSEVTGYPHGEILGRNPRLLKTNHTPPEAYQVIWRKLLAGEVWRGEMLNRRKDGTLFWAEVSMAPIRNETGDISGFVSLQEDITARKQAESALITAKETAEAANRAKSDFLNTMSHELRTPLTVILGYLPLLIALPGRNPSAKRVHALLRELRDPDAAPTESIRDLVAELAAEFEKLMAVVSRMAGDMKRNGDHLLSLINDLLDIAKIEAGKFTLDLRRLEVACVGQTVLDSMRGKAEEKGLQLVGVFGEERVCADETRLRQILLNLVGNAVKFTDSGEIRVSTRQKGEWVEFAVQDQGPGIPGDQLEEVFARFHQVDGSSTRKAGGTGLGLTITRKLVELHGGVIVVESALNQGATFRFTIPSCV